MSNTENVKRTVSRTQTSVQVVVKGRESLDEFWKEVALTENVSKLGANFRLKKACRPGQILSLMMKMPKSFRCYDWDKKLYPVWAIVQHCTPTARPDTDGYQIGVAFVGKHAPQSYQEDPLKIYKIVGMDDDGFWNIGETKVPFVYRQHPRYPQTLQVSLATIDSAGIEKDVDNDAVTKDISVGGSAVYSDLKVEKGDHIKFTCPDYNFTAIGIVCNRQKMQGDQFVLHMSFAEAEFPIKRLLNGR